jgi:hypothetical protein
MALRHRASLVLLFGLAACDEAVELGTQCRPQIGCPKDASTQGGKDGGDPGGGLGDDGGLDEGDAAPGGPSDEGFDPALDFFDNGGLEAASGGDLVTGIVLSPDDPGAMAAWRPCQIISLSTGSDAGGIDTASNTVLASATVNNTTVEPAEGTSFVAMGFPPVIPPSLTVVPLSQTLTTPLEAGRSYAFTAKVYRVDSQHDYSLRVYLSDAAPVCVPPGSPAPTPAAEVPVPDRAEWTEVCLSFTPDVEAREILIAAGTSYFGVPAEKTVAFFLDALHGVARCPP